MMGGFNEQGGAYGSPSVTPAQRKADTTVRPITVSQLEQVEQQMTDAPYFLDNHPISNITLVGRLIQKNATSTTVNFTFMDSTGTVEVRKWLNDPSDHVPFDVGDYVRIIGAVKIFNSKKSVLAHGIHPVRNPNQISYHLLSVINAHLTLSKPQQQTHEPQSNNQFTRMQNDVVSILRRNAHISSGVHVRDIISKLHASEFQVRDAVESLVNAGYVYTTVDDDHIQLAIIEN